MNTLKLQRVGRNYHGYIAYKDENGRYYLDLDMGEHKTPETLYHCSPSDDMDGEPGWPLAAKFEVLNPFTDKELKMQRFRLEYSVLSRILDDCAAFVGKTGNEENDKWDCRYHNQRGIWGGDVEELVAEMKRIWNKIPEDIKPQWCTAQKITELERKAMVVGL